MLSRPVAIFLLAAVISPAAIKTGPAVGATIPAFSLPDQNGQMCTLSTIAGPSGVMIVFYRSADW
jgi:AhpC/TSA family